MSCCGSTCSRGKIGCLTSEPRIRSCLCQGNVSRLDRVECSGFRSRGSAVTDACPGSCQCAEEEAWNKSIPPKPNCEWFSNFKELRRQWSNHSRQQNCRCYTCTAYRKAAMCQSCLQPVSCCPETDRDSEDCCKDCLLIRCPNESKPKPKPLLNPGCTLVNQNPRIIEYQNSQVHRPRNCHGSYLTSPRIFFKKRTCCQCSTECRFCRTSTKICNCSYPVKENAQNERDCSFECPPPSRDLKFPRNKTGSSDKLCCPRCQLPTSKCVCFKCEPCSLPTTECRKCKINIPRTACCREDLTSCSYRSKSPKCSKSTRYQTADNFCEESHVTQGQLQCHNSSGTLDTFAEIINQDCHLHCCCCCDSEIDENKREIHNQEHCGNNQDSLLPKNCFQCPICSTLLSSVPWKCSRTFLFPKLCKSYAISEERISDKFAREDSTEKTCNKHCQGDDGLGNRLIKFDNTCRNEQELNHDESILKHKSFIEKLENSLSFRKECCSGNENLVKGENSILPSQEDKETSDQFTASALDSNKDQYDSEEDLIRVKDCARYARKRRQVACKFKLDRKENISRPKSQARYNSYQKKGSASLKDWKQLKNTVNSFQALIKINSDDNFQNEEKSPEKLDANAENNVQEKSSKSKKGNRKEIVNNSESTIYLSSNHTLIDSQTGNRNQENENKSGVFRVKNLSNDVDDDSNVDRKNYKKQSTNDALSETSSDECIANSCQKNLTFECKCRKSVRLQNLLCECKLRKSVDI